MHSAHALLVKALQYALTGRKVMKKILYFGFVIPFLL